ncbi:MAG: hypothetical protein JWM41_3559 [Gemmatimonadetes bacterium]|nr:hypothetical protein [Gemmatimonadota bacterium]
MAAASSPSGTTSSGIGLPVPAQTSAWRVTTLEHVDLWLHGFALLTSDTGRVPFFARGYKQQVTALKRQRNLFTQLDANQHDLSARFATNPGLANAQFVAMYFPSFQEIVNATDLFIRSSGNPRAASDPQMQQEIALLAGIFPTPADRNWLRLFVQSLQDESTRFYHGYWTNEQQARGAAYAAFREAWMSRYYQKFSRFLNNTQQSSGQLALSLPLGGEGRTINDGKQYNMIAVDYPTTVDAAPEALYGFVHEAVAKLVEESIRDNTSPAEQRSGTTLGYSGNGAVRAGALLLQRVAPEEVQGYMRFYLRTLGTTSPQGDPTAAFAAAFPIPAAILTAVSRQIDVVLGGI